MVGNYPGTGVMNIKTKLNDPKNCYGCLYSKVEDWELKCCHDEFRLLMTNGVRPQACIDKHKDTTHVEDIKHTAKVIAAAVLNELSLIISDDNPDLMKEIQDSRLEETIERYL